MEIEAEVLPPVSDIVVAVEANPQIVLLDGEKFDAFYEKMKAETDKLVPDVSTKKGRDEIRSLASRVTTTRTSIEKARLALTSGWRQQTAKVNEAGKVIEGRLKALAEDVRAPLTAWEDEQKAIEERCRKTMDFLRNAAIITLGDTLESVRERGSAVHFTEIPEAEFGALYDEALTLKGIAVTALKEAMDRLKREEEDRAELQRLRDEREAREREERERIEREEAAKAEAARKEQKAQAEAARQKAEQEAIERAAAEASDKARLAAEQQAQRKIDEANARAAEAEKAAQEERDRAAKAEADRKAKEDAERAEQAKREADLAHRTAVKTKAKEAIMSCGADEETAKKIVMAIIAREVPHVSLAY